MTRQLGVHANAGVTSGDLRIMSVIDTEVMPQLFDGHALTKPIKVLSGSK